MLENNPRILYTMPGSMAGGGHLGTLEIIEGIRPYGFEPLTVVNEQPSGITSLLEEKKIPYSYIPGFPGLMWKNTGEFFTQVLHFWTFIKKHKISLIHQSDMITGHYGTLAAWLARIPSILHLKSLYWTKEYGWPNRFILSRASLIIAISDAVHRAAVSARLPKYRIVTIHDGVELAAFPPKEESGSSVRAEMGISEGVPVIGFVSRLGVEWKNEPLVYRLVGELSQKIENLSLLVVGGPYDGKNETFEKSKRLARELGQRAEIRFLGSRNDVPAILPAMDVYLVPSKEEPFGRVVIEGMAAGLPVVGSNNGGIPEMIRDDQDGFLRSPDDLKGWIEIVKTLFEDKDLRRRIGKNARKTVEERFTLEGMIERVAREYLRLLKTKRTNQNAN